MFQCSWDPWGAMRPVEGFKGKNVKTSVILRYLKSEIAGSRLLFIRKVLQNKQIVTLKDDIKYT